MGKTASRHKVSIRLKLNSLCNTNTLVCGQRSRVIINFAKVSSDNVKDSSKYREVPSDTFRKDILSRIYGETF